MRLTNAKRTLLVIRLVLAAGVALALTAAVAVLVIYGALDLRFLHGVTFSKTAVSAFCLAVGAMFLLVFVWIWFVLGRDDVSVGSQPSCADDDSKLITHN